jgi:hypothetical protein
MAVFVVRNADRGKTKERKKSPKELLKCLKDRDVSLPHIGCILYNQKIQHVPDLGYDQMCKLPRPIMIRGVIRVLTQQDSMTTTSHHTGIIHLSVVLVEEPIVLTRTNRQPRNPQRGTSHSRSGVAIKVLNFMNTKKRRKRQLCGMLGAVDTLLLERRSRESAKRLCLR